jgi:ElaB/YqjD/DUF883 family membrane-anchored ribosome-binding protein
LKSCRKKEAEAQKLKRDKRVLEQQSRALLQLPGRKARSEADELKAQIGALEEDKRVSAYNEKVTKRSQVAVKCSAQASAKRVSTSPKARKLSCGRQKASFIVAL